MAGICDVEYICDTEEQDMIYEIIDVECRKTYDVQYCTEKKLHLSPRGAGQSPRGVIIYDVPLACCSLLVRTCLACCRCGSAWLVSHTVITSRSEELGVL